jgi:hypothetical protein
MTTPLVKSTTDELIEEAHGERVSKGTERTSKRWLRIIDEVLKAGIGKHLRQDVERMRRQIEQKIQYGGTSKLRERIAELEEAQRWVPVTERLPEPGLLVQVYSPPQPGDWPDTVRIDTDGIDPESEDYWVGHGEHYERYCMIAKGGDVEWTGPAEKAPYTHWKPMPKPPL